MKLAKLRVENFRQLGSPNEPFEIDFTDALGRVRDLSLLIGPNGCGKTTILDSIAAALGPILEMPTTRTAFTLNPRSIVPRGQLQAKVSCDLRFEPDEIETASAICRLSEIPDSIPHSPEVNVTWTYPDPKRKSKFGFTQCYPSTGWELLKTRVRIARLLSTGRVGWSSFQKAGGVFTFDQERTGLGKTISRQVWNIIHGNTSFSGDKAERRTTDPRTILIAMAIQSLVPSADDMHAAPDLFRLVKERYARVCEPREIVGAVQDELGEFDIYFEDGKREYRYEGLSSGEKMALLLLVRFVAEHMHKSIVLIDELELNQHPLWQRRLLHMIPKMGEGNQVVATTHSPYLRDAVSPDSVYDLGDLGDKDKAGY